MATLRPTARPLVGALLRPRTHAVRRQTAAAGARFKSGPYGYTQAKALVYSKFGEPADVLNLHTHSISPTLPDGAVLLRTLAAPINPADINMIQGTYGAKPTFSSLVGTPEPAAVPGGEACFEVAAVGAGVSTLKKGDWAIPAAQQMGTWRTHALVEDADRRLQRVDSEGLTPLQAATVAVNPCSAWRLLRDFVDLVELSVKAYGPGGDEAGGAWFVQNGANSGVGRAAIQLGRLWGLRSINVVRARPTPEETDALRRELEALGATVVVTEDELLDRAFPRRVRDELTRGGREPLMLGLNCVGGKSATAMAKLLSEGGTLVTYGAMSRQPVALPTGLLIFRDLAFRGFWLSRWAAHNPEAKRRTVDQILDLVRAGKFADAPVQEIPWTWDTKIDDLRAAVEGTLGGFRKGKGVFVFKDT